VKLTYISGDAGWGCGYRNLQMISSYLFQNNYFTKQLFGGIGFIPSVPEIQRSDQQI
jgi:hypothetical protein